MYNDETEVETTDVTINDLKPYQNRFNVVFKVTSKGETREVSNRNNPDETHRVNDVVVGDDTASIILTVWDDDIDLMEVDKTFALKNGFVNVFRDSMRLGRGKFGNFEESENEIDEVNLEVNRSEEVHERRSRRRFDSDSGGGNRNRKHGDSRSNQRRW